MVYLVDYLPSTLNMAKTLLCFFSQCRYEYYGKSAFFFFTVSITLNISEQCCNSQAGDQNVLVLGL